TYSYSARRPFEVAYWKAIASLAEGKFLNKNNADCVLDDATQGVLPYRDRHLDALGDMLLAYYRKKIAAATMAGKALAGEVSFRLRTGMGYPGMGGWGENQGAQAEGGLLLVIPGRDRRQGVIPAAPYRTHPLLR